MPEPEIESPRSELTALRAERDKVVKWWAESFQPINSAIHLATIHGSPYRGTVAPQWLIDEAIAAREALNA